MRIQKHIQLTICLAVVLSLPTLASAQQFNQNFASR